MKLRLLLIFYFLFFIFYFVFSVPVYAVSSKGALRAAYNSQENRFFLVWTDGRNSTEVTDPVGCYKQEGCNQDIYGAFLSNSLQLGQEIPLATEPNEQNFPDIAYNSKRNEYLVVYQRRNNDFDIWGVRLDKNGQVLSSIPICQEISDQWEPTVAYDGMNDHYLVTWMTDSEADKDIKIQLLSGEGSKIGQPRFISLEESGSLARGKQERPVISFSEEQKFIVTWEDEGRGGGGGTVLDKEGNILISPKNFFFSQGQGRVIYPQISYSTYQKQVMVVWQEGFGEGNKKVIVQRLDLSGQKIGSQVILDSETTNQNPRPGIACDSDNGSCLIGWFNWTEYAGKLQFIDKDGKKSGSVLEGLGWRPSITFNFKERYFLVVKSDNPALFKKVNALPLLPTPTPSSSPTLPPPSPTTTLQPSAFLNLKASFPGANQGQPFLAKVIEKTTNFLKQIILKDKVVYQNLPLEGLSLNQKYDFFLYSFPFLSSKKSLTIKEGNNPKDSPALDFGVLKTGDLNGDNQVNGLDWSLMKSNFGETGQE